jgi:hypothetical protein
VRAPEEKQPEQHRGQPGHLPAAVEHAGGVPDRVASEDAAKHGKRRMVQRRALHPWLDEDVQPLLQVDQRRGVGVGRARATGHFDSDRMVELKGGQQQAQVERRP